MKQIIGGRGTGKTKELLQYAQERDAVVVCKHPIRMQEKAEAYGIYGLRFVGYEEPIIGILYVIDDLDEYFAAHSPNMIGFSLNHE